MNGEHTNICHRRCCICGDLMGIKSAGGSSDGYTDGFCDLCLKIHKARGYAKMEYNDLKKINEQHGILDGTFAAATKRLRSLNRAIMIRRWTVKSRGRVPRIRFAAA